MQIGGSLAKIVYFASAEDRKGGRLHFKKFETEKIDECIDFIAELVAESDHKEQVLKATGGGAHLYYEKLQQRLPTITVQKEDEMDCLITGAYHCQGLLCCFSVGSGDSYINARFVFLLLRLLFFVGLDFFISEIPYEVFTYSEQNPMRFEERAQALYPYMVYIF